MRIALIQDHLRNGGTENQTLHIAQGLAERGIDSHVVVFRQGGVLDDKARQSDFALHFLEQGILVADWFAPGLDALLRSLKIDVAIAMGRMANCQAGLLCRHDLPYKVVATFRTGKAIPWLQRLALRKSDHLVANSHEALDRVDRLYEIKRENSSVIYNGCIRKPDNSSQNPLAPKPVQLVSASMFRPEKKQIRLLRICAQLPAQLDWRLTLAGDGPQREPCIQEANRLGIEHRVQFPGLVDPSELYSKSHIAVHASAKESLPNFLVEAQMFGLPVVAYDVDGVGETFRHQTSGYLVDQGDEDAFVERLVQLAESPDLRLQMSQAARDYAKQTFSPEAQIDAYVELLHKLA